MNKLFMLALTLLFVIPCLGQEKDTVNVEKEIAPIDTTLHLNEVVVKAARVIHKVDRDIILPNAKIKENSSNGYDLLRKLHLPNLKVNEAQQSISSYLGGVQVRINDIKATVQDICCSCSSQRYCSC